MEKCLRIQLNSWASFHYPHLDPIRQGERIFVLSLGGPGIFTWAGQQYLVREGCVLGWGREDQQVHGILGAEGWRGSIAITFGA